MSVVIDTTTGCKCALLTGNTSRPHYENVSASTNKIEDFIFNDHTGWNYLHVARSFYPDYEYYYVYDDHITICKSFQNDFTINIENKIENFCYGYHLLVVGDNIVVYDGKKIYWYNKKNQMNIEQDLDIKQFLEFKDISGWGGNFNFEYIDSEDRLNKISVNRIIEDRSRRIIGTSFDVPTGYESYHYVDKFNRIKKRKIGHFELIRIVSDLYIIDSNKITRCIANTSLFDELNIVDITEEMVFIGIDKNEERCYYSMDTYLHKFFKINLEKYDIITHLEVKSARNTG